jgi:predicted DNA-binding protein
LIQDYLKYRGIFDGLRLIVNNDYRLDTLIEETERIKESIVGEVLNSGFRREMLALAEDILASKLEKIKEGILLN